MYLPAAGRFRWSSGQRTHRSGRLLMACWWLFLLAGFVFMPAATAGAGTITPEQLKADLDNGVHLTLVDIRDRPRYQAAHLPGAISIPAAVLDRKRLPALGRVIVYGDGIDVGRTRAALDLMNARSGIEADMLLGGMGAWQTLRYPVTRGPGLYRKQLRELTYEELAAAASANSDLVLVDVRPAPARQTDLAALFPLPPVCVVPWRNGGWDIRACLPADGTLHRRLFVLIGSGHGEAAAVADQFLATGSARVAMLIGGEKSLQRRGQASSRTTTLSR